MTNETLEPQTLEPVATEDLTPESRAIVEVLRGIQAELKQLNRTVSALSAGQAPRFPRSGPVSPAGQRTERAETGFDTPKPKRTSPKKRAKVKGKLPAKKGGGYPKNPR